MFFWKQKSYEQRLEESIDFLRQLEFFKEYKRMTTANVARKLEAFQKENGLPAFRASRGTADLDLVAWDKKRIWFEDFDALVLPENEAYVQAFQELAGISRKSFSPSSVKEFWEGEEGPVVIQFSLRRKIHEIRPQYSETYFDYGIIQKFNEILGSTGQRFEFCGDMNGNPMVVMLTKEEKEILQKRRGWKFDTPIPA